MDWYLGSRTGRGWYLYAAVGGRAGFFLGWGWEGMGPRYCLRTMGGGGGFSLRVGLEEEQPILVRWL